MSLLKSSHLKIDRAQKHIGELSDLLSREKAFRYIVETDTKTLKRTAYAKPNEAVIDEISVIGSDILHQLRSALDHAFFAVVKPHFPQGQGAAQFPFSRDAAGLEAAIKNRCAHKVSNDFYDFILALNTHGEPAGNRILYLLHEANIVDKHRTFLPTSDQKTISSATIRKYAPDFPFELTNISIEGCDHDAVWRGPRSILNSIGLPGMPLGRKHELEIPVPISIRFHVGESHHSHEILPTLETLAANVREVVKAMERFV